MLHTPLQHQDFVAVRNHQYTYQGLPRCLHKCCTLHGTRKKKNYKKATSLFKKLDLFFISISHVMALNCNQNILQDLKEYLSGNWFFHLCIYKSSVYQYDIYYQLTMTTIKNIAGRSLSYLYLFYIFVTFSPTHNLSTTLDLPISPSSSRLRLINIPVSI